jgi:ubiquinone/menaquinone biosynthesis C-methylase UbiE
MKSADKFIRSHYLELLRKHGDVAASAQWSSRESLERRFRQLIRIGDLQDASILDFGCGSGHLATYLERREISVRYTGVDIVPELLELGKAKHPQHRFGELMDFSEEKFDYVLISGVFNNCRKNSRSYWQQSVRTLFSLCKKGLAFNMMSKYVEYENDELFYEEPEKAFSFVKKNITPYVNLIHDYQVKDDCIPFEFCIQALKIPTP